MPFETSSSIANKNRRVFIPLARCLKRLSSRAEGDPHRVLDEILKLAHVYHHWLAMDDERMGDKEAERCWLDLHSDAERRTYYEGMACTEWLGGARAKGQILNQGRDPQGYLLYSQISPHFFLNALNAMAGLLDEDPPKAARGLADLAEVYRKLVSLGRKEKAPLAEERRLLERYLGVEKLRLEDSLQITWQWDRELDGILTLPFLLYPLVENAIKQGISKSASGGHLVISARCQPGEMVLVVSNSDRTSVGLCRSFCYGASGLSERLPGGDLGILYVKQSLELSYGKSAKLEIREEGSWTHATVMIPFVKGYPVG